MGDHSQTGSTYSNSRYDGNDKRRQKIPFDPTKFAQAQQSAAGSAAGSAARSVPASFGGGTGGSVAGSDATGFSQPQSSRGLPSGFSTLSKADQEAFLYGERDDPQQSRIKSAVYEDDPKRYERMMSKDADSRARFPEIYTNLPPVGTPSGSLMRNPISREKRRRDPAGQYDYPGSEPGGRYHRGA